MSCGGSGRLDGGWKDGSLMFFFCYLRCFGELLLEAVPGTKVFSGGGSQMGFIPGCEGNPVRVVTWLAMAWAGHTEEGKIAA